MAEPLDEDLERLTRELSQARADQLEQLSRRVEELIDAGAIDVDALFKALERTEAALAATPEKREEHFGKLAVESGYLRQQDVDAALKEQKVLAGRGLTVPIGRILQRSGRLKIAQVLEILRKQDKHVIACPCGTRYLIEKPRSDMQYKCGSCGRVLEPPATIGLALGTRVGRFDIEREIGRGRTGIVYSARDAELDRRVALKVLAGVDPERFRREASAIARLRHPNIVNVQEAGEAGGHLYVAMDLLEGKTFDQAGLAQRDAVTVIEQVARAVAHAHEQGVVHRDLRPRNVIVEKTRDGAHFAWVLDFAVPPPGAPTETGADVTALAAMVREQAGDTRELRDVAETPPASAKELADALRRWLGATRRYR